ncbi:hypothetical protein [Mesorhizobium sp. M1143]|uniref:hypothetical protein n=1 Tax=Mesorhizobium sp. M1143 TaxID=2957061 RepID=UPI00333598D5
MLERLSKLPETLNSPALLQAAKGLKGADKRSFRDAFHRFFFNADVVSPHDATLLREFFEAKMRAQLLKEMLTSEMEDEGAARVATPSVLALIRQSDATSRLVLKLADRLKSPAR